MAHLDNRAEEIEDIIRTSYTNSCPTRTIHAYKFRVSTETLKLIKRKKQLLRLAKKDNRFKTSLYQVSREIKKRICTEKYARWKTATSSE